jgi:hypothetical protein
MEETKINTKFLSDTLKIRDNLENLDLRWEDSIKICLKEVCLEGADRIYLAQDKVQCRTFYTRERNFWFQKRKGFNSLA